MKNKLKLFVDMDGTLTEWKKADFKNNLISDTFFSTLKPHKELIEFLNMCNNQNAVSIEIFIASAYIEEKGKIGKNLWLDKYFPIKEKNRIFIPSTINKSIYIINHLKEPISKTHILLDDHTPNLIEWRNAGGTAIKALNGVNRIEGKWDGLLFDIFKLKFIQEDNN